MFKRKLTIADFFLILINLIPLYGVWFEGWNPVQVFLVYCLETVIIGVVNVIKMSCVTLFVRRKDVWENGSSSSMQSGWLFVFFFIFHYGFFVFVQTQVFFGVTGIAGDASFFGKYAQIPALLGDNGKLLLFIFITYYTLQNIFSFFVTGNYKTVSLGRLLFEPYARIFVQQIVVIFGSFFLSFGAGKIFILVFIAVKIFFELFVNFDRFLAIAEKKAKQKSEMKNKD